MSLSSGRMPEARPVLKKTDADYKQFANFRPISKLKMISKAMEKVWKVVAMQLMDHISSHQLHEWL